VKRKLRQKHHDLQLMVKPRVDFFADYRVRFWAAAAQARECWQQHDCIVGALLTSGL
jgi:hypothetical protein